MASQNQNQMIAQFKSDLQNELSKELGVITKEVQVIAYNIVENATERTVVDTSTALSNWVLTLNNPSDGQIGAHFTGEKGSTKAQSQDEALVEAALNVIDFKLGESIFVVNDLVDDLHTLNAHTIQASQIAEEIAFVELQKIESLLGN